MSRIDNVFKAIKEGYREQGVTTIELANALNLSRANVSNDLNRLCEEGKLKKISGKPVLYIISEDYKEDISNSSIDNNSSIINEKKTYTNTLDLFAEKNESLHIAIEQAKAAILYPPNGMSTLILGETGVGKSMFVELMYKYAIEMKVFSKESPFIVFNCADYANNPQLLLSQLFGCKKGAYTGADTDKIGLIEKANDGILFLDEVHRLPAEGQEMLFTFMDKGVYRRLGETEFERRAKVLIISATTEDPEKALLKTFLRRVPMLINIPELSKRTINERFELIATFFKEECLRLDRDIKVSINSIKSMLSYNCTNNIGQLKADIQLVCAKVYADFVLGKKSEIKINTLDLPNYIREGLFVEVEHRQLWGKLIDLNRRYCIFSKENNEIIFEDYNNEINIYELVDIRYRELKSRGLNDEELQDNMMNEIDNYFSKYIHNLENKLDKSNLSSLIDSEIINVIEQIIKFSEEALGFNFNKKVYYGMAMHINASIDRIKSNRKIQNPQLNKIRVNNKREFNIALDCLKIIERALDITMPIDEAGFLTKFFIFDDNIKNVSKMVKVVVIAHGKNTASSMVEAVNELIGVNYAIGIDAPMYDKPEKVLERFKNYIEENNIKDDIILLVDMGSLTTFGKLIEGEFKINIKVFPLVSTLHVVEATRKAVMGYPLDKIFNDVLKVNDLYKSELKEIKELDKVNLANINDQSNLKKMAIVSICSTGEGGAMEIKNILSKELLYDKNILEIITLRYEDDDSVEKELESLANHYNLISIVSAFDVKSNVTTFGVDELICGSGLSKLQNIVDVENIYYKLNNTLNENLKSISGTEIIKDIRNMISNVQKLINKNLKINIIVGVVLHIACMIDRVRLGEKVEKFEDKDYFISNNKKLYQCVKNETLKLNRKYNINIHEDEICFIMKFFKSN